MIDCGDGEDLVPFYSKLVEKGVRVISSNPQIATLPQAAFNVCHGGDGDGDGDGGGFLTDIYL